MVTFGPMMLALVIAAQPAEYPPAPAVGDQQTAMPSDYQTAFEEPSDYSQPTDSSLPVASTAPPQVQISRENVLRRRRSTHTPILQLKPAVQRNPGAQQVIQQADYAPATEQTSSAVEHEEGATPSLLLQPPGKLQAFSLEMMPGVSLPTVVGSLSGVTGLFLIFAWAWRRGGRRGSGVLPVEVAEMLGRVPLVGKQQAHLLRLGAKLVLVSITPEGVKPLAEVTEPEEVDRLLSLCYDYQTTGNSRPFNQMLQGYQVAHAAGQGADRLELGRYAGVAGSVGRKESGHAR